MMNLSMLTSSALTVVSVFLITVCLQNECVQATEVKNTNTQHRDDGIPSLLQKRLRNSGGNNNNRFGENKLENISATATANTNTNTNTKTNTKYIDSRRPGCSCWEHCISTCVWIASHCYCRSVTACHYILPSIFSHHTNDHTTAYYRTHTYILTVTPLFSFFSDRRRQNSSPQTTQGRKRHDAVRKGQLGWKIQYGNPNAVCRN
mmetsp:Transcript_11641/g.16610  ORF Transcript_11641/g.16610 Transcript_11641/m.16610 type:complete len:205 (+) Transcript_11641:58-672(+)